MYSSNKLEIKNICLWLQGGEGGGGVQCQWPVRRGCYPDVQTRAHSLGTSIHLQGFEKDLPQAEHWIDQKKKKNIFRLS